MAKSQETFNKKEREKKRLKKRQDKKERKEERKANSKENPTMEYSYLDENGHYSSTPPDPSKKHKVKAEDILVSTPKQDPSVKPDTTRSGRITFFNEGKGFGFIQDDQTQESVFVHVNSMIDQVREGARVTFKTERGPKGMSAVDVRIKP